MYVINDQDGNAEVYENNLKVMRGKDLTKKFNDFKEIQQRKQWYGRMDDPIKRVITLYDDGFGEGNDCLYDQRVNEFKMTEEEKNEMEAKHKAYTANLSTVAEAIQQLTVDREKKYHADMLKPKTNKFDNSNDL